MSVVPGSELGVEAFEKNATNVANILRALLHEREQPLTTVEHRGSDIQGFVGLSGQLKRYVHP